LMGSFLRRELLLLRTRFNPPTEASQIQTVERGVDQFGLNEVVAGIATNLDSALARCLDDCITQKSEIFGYRRGSNKLWCNYFMLELHIHRTFSWALRQFFLQIFCERAVCRFNAVCTTKLRYCVLAFFTLKQFGN
jgi:hypothetical protein